VGPAAALVAAPLTFFVANLGDALTRSPGQDDTTARGALEIAAAHPLADTITWGEALGAGLQTVGTRRRST
jgi:hypothetical protein